MQRRDFLSLLGTTFSTSLLADSFSLEDAVSSLNNGSDKLLKKRVQKYKKYYIPKIMVRNNEVQKYIHQIAEPFFSVSNRKVDWNIFVTNKGGLACTFGAGLIVINKKLIKMCDNESQLVSVIAHEVGHVHHNHLETSIELKKLHQVLDLNHLDKTTLLKLSRSFSRLKERG